MKKNLTSVMFVLAAAVLQAQTIVYVKNGATGDGSSWANASSLEGALSKSLAEGTQIWVQKGHYYPTQTLVVPESVQVYGSFEGTEKTLSQRASFESNLTTIDAQNKFGSVIYLNTGAEINGFAIQNGYANDNPHRDGGGVWANDDCRITNCFIINNRALGNGGGMYARGHVTMTYSSVYDNSAGSVGDDVFGNCLTFIAGQGWEYDMLPSSDPFAFEAHPSTARQVGDQNVVFPTLSVSVNGNAPINYQWYQNADNSNLNGTAIPGATGNTFTPPSVTSSQRFYYCVVSNPDGTMTSNVSGNHIVRAHYVMSNCNSNAPNWGAGGLGTVGFASNTEFTVSGNGGKTQVWSDAVTASACANRGTTEYTGGSSPNYNADCRNNPDFPGDLFSWCAVARFKDELCPAPWRVPDAEDFQVLMLILGGTAVGPNGYFTNTGVRDKLIAQSGTAGEFWGGNYSGRCYGSGALFEQKTYARYWMLTESNLTNGYAMGFYTSGLTYPFYNYTKDFGMALRCVKWL